MNTATKFITTISATLFSIFSFTTPVSASDLAFEILGVNSSNGKLYIQLFKGEKNYQQGKTVSASAINAKKGSVTVLFNNIEEGEYVLRFFHDENDDGEMQKNLSGMPVEGYGFSNNAKPNFGPASYNDMKFLVSATDTKVRNQTTVIY